jgi:type VII secretion-associated serine protease mycosin
MSASAVPASPAAATRRALPRVVGATCDPDVPASVAQQPPALDRLGVEAVWATSTGAGVLVAVVDSGVDVRNAHLTSAVLPGVDLTGPDSDGAGHTDEDGHGTAIAGQVAARPVDGSGVVGVAPDALVLPVRVYRATDEQAVRAGQGVRTDRIAAGIVAAVERGARVVNVSLSSPEDDPALRAAVELATERGALVVASAGNRTTTEATEDSPRYPAAYDGVLGVAAVDAADRPTEDSIHGPHVDVAAPGTEVLTTFHAAGDCLLGGTASSSFATAYVSGAAALVAQAHPDETPTQWAYRLMATAARPDVRARDDRVGWGVVRPADAVTLVDDGSLPGPVHPVHPARPALAVDAGTLEVAPSPDTTTPVRRALGWWVVGGATVVVLAALGAQLRVGGRRGRTG